MTQPDFFIECETVSQFLSVHKLSVQPPPQFLQTAPKHGIFATCQNITRVVIVMSMENAKALAAALVGAAFAGLGALIFALADQWSTDFGASIWQSRPWVMFLLMPGGLALILFLRDRVFPGTDGTGIPQTIAALKSGPGPLRDRLLSGRVAVGKTILTVLGLFSCLSIGREGPAVQLGACMMHMVSRWAKFPAHLIERGLILGGGAAGISAAFNAPLAGVVFAFEEIGRSFDKRNLGTILRTVVIACLVTMSVLGNYFFYGNYSDYATGSEFLSPLAWVAVVAIGVIGGGLGGLFSKYLLAVMPWVSRRIRASFWKVAVVIGLASACLAWISDGATLNGGRDQAAAILAASSPEYTANLLTDEAERLALIDESCGPAYPALRAAASFLALVTGIPGGLFDPSFSVGAGLGKWAAPWLAWTGVSPLAVVLLFIVAYFSGVVQSPVTSCVILVEMTGLVAFTLPLAAAAVIAYETSRRICPNALYESLAQNFLRKEESSKP
jgi:H+/Cl- antiporter ClcA